jgi:transcriptional regulator with XRE-family HTH domain
MAKHLLSKYVQSKKSKRPDPKKIGLLDFARRTQSSQTQVARWLKEDYDPKLSVLDKWAKALGVKIRDLYKD